MSLASTVSQTHLLSEARHGLPRLIMITDQRRQPDIFEPLNRLPLGSAVILRDYDAPERSALATRMRLQTRARGILMLIAGDPTLATDIGADGVHLPEHMLRDAATIRRQNPGWLITSAAHSYSTLRRSKSARLDAALLSPVFPTRSHPGASVLGPYRHAALQKSAPGLPIYALGGVNSKTACRLPPGIQGWAAIDGI